MDLEKIGMYIAKCRKEMEMTQEELANKLKITAKAVSKWECGRGLPDISIMLELCYLLGINIISLLMGEDSNTEYTIRKVGGSFCKKKKRILHSNKYPKIGNLSKEKIFKIKDVIGVDEIVTIKGNVEGYCIEEKDYTIRCELDIRDDTESIKASLKDNQNLELKTLIGQIQTGDIYKMRGYYTYDEIMQENRFLIMQIEKL